MWSIKNDWIVVWSARGVYNYSFKKGHVRIICIILYSKSRNRFKIEQESSDGGEHIGMSVYEKAVKQLARFNALGLCPELKELLEKE